MESSELRNAERLAKASRTALIDRRSLVLAPPDLPALIRRLRQPLDAVKGTALDDEWVASISETRITAGALRGALELREAEVAEQQQNALVEDIDLNLAKVNRHLRDLKAASKLLTQVDRARERLRGVEIDLREVVNELSARPDHAYKALLDELEAAQRSVLDLVARRAELRYRKGILEREGSEVVLADGIAALRMELGVQGSIGSALQEARSRFEGCRARLQACDEEYRRAAVARTDLDHRLDETVALFERGPDYSWLRNAVLDRLPSANDDRFMSAERLAALEAAVLGIQGQMSALEKQAASIYDGLRSLAKSEGMTDPTLNPYVPSLASYYERRFGDLLSDPEIEVTLFDGGHFVGLDLQRWEISWITADNESRRRPIAAFSSGERAFAYVLASILRIADSTAANRLLVLDEFGSFLEVARLNRLESFLSERVLRPGRAEQVVIILPLRSLSFDTASHDSGSTYRTSFKEEYFMKEIPI